jgi:hypothetical protein
MGHGSGIDLPNLHLREPGRVAVLERWRHDERRPARCRDRLHRFAAGHIARAHERADHAEQPWI